MNSHSMLLFSILSHRLSIVKADRGAAGTELRGDWQSDWHHV